MQHDHKIPDVELSALSAQGEGRHLSHQGPAIQK